MHPGRSGAMGASFGVANGKVTGESALTDGVSKSADTSLAGAPSHLLGSEVLLEETDTSIEDMHGQEEASAECSLSARQPHTRLQRWLLVRRVLRPEVGKVGNRTTEVAMAFALNESDVDSLQPPPPLDVFAFLPLRSYGLRFILHADWEVPIMPLLPPTRACSHACHCSSTAPCLGHSAPYAFFCG